MLTGAPEEREEEEEEVEERRRRRRWKRWRKRRRRRRKWRMQVKIWKEIGGRGRKRGQDWKINWIYVGMNYFFVVGIAHYKYFGSPLIAQYYIHEANVFLWIFRNAYTHVQP